MKGSSEAVQTPGTSAGADELALSIPADPEQVRTARLFAGATARHFGLDEETVEDLKVAISEAVTNAIRAHTDAGTDEPIRVLATAGADSIRFDVVDRGAAAAARTVIADGDYTPPVGFGDSTLGLLVISSLFPRVEFTPNPDGGTTVSIRIERGEVEA